jgi:soluble lytic murein transglycosylase-like protein
MAVDLNPFIKKAAGDHGLPVELVSAMVQVESSRDPFAVRFEPGWKYFHFPRELASRIAIPEATERTLQACSWGPMQVMGAVAREYGLDGHLAQLVMPHVALEYSCRHLKRFLVKYGIESAAIAAYNAGSARKTPGGMYENQNYVDKVHAELTKLRALK